MHTHDASTEVLTQAIVRAAVERVRLDDPPLDAPRAAADLVAMTGNTITPDGIGGLEALRLFTEVLAPACLSVDHQRFLAFVPAAPTEAATLFDLLVGASSVYGGSWIEGSGAVHAENQALRWLADLASFPADAGGVFVSGGTAGNLSALIAARARWRDRVGGAFDRTRALFVGARNAHSSIVAAGRAMDADVLLADTDVDGRLDPIALRSMVEGLDADDRARVAAVIATSGSTNAGLIDPLGPVADLATELGAWFHVDGAYGAAALAAPSLRHRFAGIERADSFIVDPHKWLFAPFDCCALVYREPLQARRAHTQHAEYLDALHDAKQPDWNPSDFAHHLSRRARGLPFWFSLATYGTRAYGDAVETSVRVAHEGADLIRSASHLHLVSEPELSVLLFRRTGFAPADYDDWSTRMLTDGEAFVVPTTWKGETVLRLCLVNPRTTLDDLRLIFDSLA